jgi:hypothetical protein
MPRRCLLTAALATLLLVPAPARAGRWLREADGTCRYEWTPRSLARGPIAMGNGVLMPFRSLAGSASNGWLAGLLLPLGLMVGLAEGIAWTTVGAVETVSGGALALAPEGAADRLHFSPVLQFPLGRRSLDEYRADGCGDAPL